MRPGFPPAGGRIAQLSGLTPHRLELPTVTVEGISIASYATVFRLMPYNILFDLGICPLDFTSARYLCLSHLHLDHWAGLPTLVALQRLKHLRPVTIIVPPEQADPLRSLLDGIGGLEGEAYRFELLELAPGAEMLLENRLWIRALAMDHMLPTQGYVLFERRRKLKPIYFGWPQVELLNCKAAGIEITDVVDQPLVGYVGDSSMAGILAHPILGEVPLLLCECTFLDRQPALERRHVALPDLAEHAGFFRNAKVILHHFSMRYTPEAIRSAFDGAFPDRWVGRLHLFGIDPGNPT